MAGPASLIERASLLLGRRLLLGTLFDRLAAIHGDRAVVEEAGARGRRLTYNEAAQRVARLADGIAARTIRGDRVVLAVPNGYDLLLLCAAACRAGTIAVPVNPKMREDEVAHVIDDSGAALVIRHSSEVEGGLGFRPAPGQPKDVAAIFYTSGTTGKPKGARLTHRALLGQITGGAIWPAPIHRDEAVVGLPVAHIMGFATLVGLAVAGIPTFLLPRFKAEAALDAIESRRSTMFVGVPAMYRLMLEAGAESRDLKSIRVWASGADVMPDDLVRRFKTMGATATLPFVDISVGEATFAEGYGMVELGGGVAAKISPPYIDFGLLGDSLGFPLPPNRLRVVDERGKQVGAGQVGELVVKGPSVLSGYHGDPEATKDTFTEDGWMRTGDLARRGPLGLVLFAGRAKDVIKHGGYSVFAVEVESVLSQHPDVAEAAVVGIDHEVKGQVPVAVIRRKPGTDPSPEDIMAFAREHLADYKCPRQVRVVDELARTGTDKVQKSGLAGLFS